MVTTATLEVIEQIHNTVDEDPCLTEREIADIKGISDVRYLRILLGELRMEKIIGKLLTHSLTIQQKLI